MGKRVIDNCPITIGIDIAYRRDSSAVVAVGRHPEGNYYFRRGHRIWMPPVHIPDVTDFVLKVVARERVVGIFYDPFQYVGESQRLIDAGYEQLIHEVNQYAHSVEFSNCLHVTFQRGDYRAYTDAQIAGQYQWTNAEASERGWRIVKRKQTRQIDVVVAEAMALWGVMDNYDHMISEAYDEEQHAQNLEDLP